MSIDFTNRQRYYYPDKFNFNRIEGVLPEARNMGRPRPMIVTGKQFIGTNALSGGRIRGRGFFGKRFKPLEGRGLSFPDLSKLPNSNLSKIARLPNLHQEYEARKLLSLPTGIYSSPKDIKRRRDAQALLDNSDKIRAEVKASIKPGGRIRMGKGLLKKINRIQGRKNQTMEGGF